MARKKLFRTFEKIERVAASQKGSAAFGRKQFGRTTSGVNFTNILQAAFSYESFLCSFYVLTIWVCKFLAKGFWCKSCS
jgi:hypothetical protein